MKIEHLTNEIVRANKKYREGGSIMTDSQYDKLLEELKELDPNNPLINKAIIEKAPKSTRKEKLPYPMYSMNKLHTLREISEWLGSKELDNKIDLIITPKYDGISLVVMDNSECWTRGNGEVGQKSNNHFSAMNENTHNINNIVFGEAIISKENWKKHFEGKCNKNGEIYKINRNTVAGLFNRDVASPELVLANYIRYGINRPEMDKKDQLDHLNKHCNNNVEQVPYLEIKACDLTEEILNDFYKENIKKFPIDGLIIDINDKKIREKLGREENMNPAYARAIKFPHWSDSADVVVKSHKFSMSKQGFLKGTVQFNPVLIKGAEVKQATFINASFLTNFGLIIGSKITICTSGDIIPKIIAVEGINIPFREYFDSQKEYEVAYNEAVTEFSLKFPERIEQISDETTYCPCCGEPLKWNETMKEKVCISSNCTDIKISKLVHFFKTIGIENFGEPTIRSLYKSGVTTIKGILSLSKEDFCSVEGLGSKLYKTFSKQVNKLKSEGLPLARTLYALDVFDGVIGEKLCQKILDERGDVWTPLSILSIDGVSKKTSKVFCQAIENLQGSDIIPFKYSYVTTPKIEVKKGGKYEGWKACFSGIRLKDEEKENFIKEGGEEVSGVNKKTTHLIVKDINSISSKMKKAKTLGIKILIKKDI